MAGMQARGGRRLTPGRRRIRHTVSGLIGTFSLAVASILVTPTPALALNPTPIRTLPSPWFSGVTS